VRLEALLLTPHGRINVGAARLIVESSPKFSPATSRLLVDSGEAPRLKRVSAFRIVVQNDGTDRAADVRAQLVIPEELRIEAPAGTRGLERDARVIAFGDIPAGETRSAVFSMRLVGAVTGGDPLTIAARITGTNVVPLNLTPIELSTYGEAAFDDMSLTSAPSGSIDAGAECRYTLRLRNTGDGGAKLLVARITQLTPWPITLARRCCSVRADCGWRTSG
jgi:hypothetical protein